MSKSNFIPCCSCCKQRVTIVKSVKGMHYCEAHKDKAPTREQYEAFMNEKVPPYSTHRFVHQGYRNVEKQI